ncbi:hypothetical protein ABNF97_13565 [Plantactinospora sp. B6F1]|uniref:hypothetical protein n=1 Tax=Plantactinospora sp. B6F1 TaxID=3158971 RepID=UPI0032D8B8CB
MRYTHRLGRKTAEAAIAMVFRCHACGHTACRDPNAASCRDPNAARTILATAARERAGADDVRHAITSSSQDGGLVRSEPGIPG